jgi:hypothetical protein
MTKKNLPGGKAIMIVAIAVTLVAIIFLAAWRLVNQLGGVSP